MYVCVLLGWLACLVLLGPRLGALWEDTPGLGARAVLACVSGQLTLFWLFGSYYLMLPLFTLLSRFWREPEPPALRGQPGVALLYVTMHDFCERAAASCLAQDYGGAHVFILDDSIDPQARAQVDAFAEAHPGRLTVLRRDDRKGFKAGSLNHALRTQVTGYPYVAIVDADSVLPPTFLRDLLPYFGLGDDIGFVQGSHAPNPEQPTAFAQDLCLGILPLWKVYYGPRNRYGNVIFLGHGGIVRYDVWEQVGGFPELVSEDLAFSTRAAALGWRGWFAHSVVSYEDFPLGYRQLRRQQEKYIKGAVEYFHREMKPFLGSRRVRWFEKLDVLLSCGSLLMPVLFLTFLLTYTVLLPLAVGESRELTVSVLGHDLFRVPVLLLPESFRVLWSWDFFLVTVACTFAPVAGCFAVIAQRPFAGLRMFLLSAVPYLSLLLVATFALVSYLTSRRAVFLVTNDRWGTGLTGMPRDFPAGGPPLERLGAEDRTTRVVEVLLGVMLIGMCALTVNLSLLAFALSMVMGPLLLRVRWESRLLRPFLYLPYACIGTGVLLGGLNVLTVNGLLQAFPLFHF